MKEAGVLPHAVTPEMVAGLGVPFIIAGVWWTLHTARKTWASTAEKGKRDMDSEILD
jgi:uncharacterized membrane-anchored protein